MPLADAASYPLWLNCAIFLAAAAVIWVAGTRLTRALDVLAGKTGLDRVFVGMLFLGVITSLPELANVITASASGNPALGINNLLGSASINILLLAVADATVGKQAITSIVARPSTMMMGTLGMITLVAIAAAVTLGDVAIGPTGIGSLAIGVASLTFFWIGTGHDQRSPWSIKQPDEARAGDADLPSSERPTGRGWSEVLIYGALLFASGYTLSQVGDALAQQLGLTSAAVGFALIGTATSLPEFVTVVAALKLNRPELAFGQVLGTNFVNLAMLPLSDLIYAGEPVLNLLGAFEIVSALLGAVLMGIFVVGLLEHRNRTVLRMGIDSVAVLIVFALGVAALARVSAQL